MPGTAGLSVVPRDVTIVGGHFALRGHPEPGIDPVISETELATFKRAVDAVAGYAGAGPAPALRLLVGDLRLPPSQRTELSWAVPKTYLSVMGQAGISAVELVAESRCRNTGARKIIASLKKQVRAGGAEALYQSSGMGLVSLGNGDNQTLFLVADCLLDTPGCHSPAIALTRQGGLPSCSVQAAGAVADAAAAGTRLYRAFYDLEDDPQIDKKLAEGVLAASLALTSLDMICEIDVSANGAPYSHAVFAAGGLRAPGRRSGLAALIDETRRAMARHSAQWIFETPVVVA